MIPHVYVPSLYKEWQDVNKQLNYVKALSDNTPCLCAFIIYGVAKCKQTTEVRQSTQHSAIMPHVYVLSLCMEWRDVNKQLMYVKEVRSQR
jgi:hypothetical protein